MPLHFRLRCKFGVHRTDDKTGFCYRVGPNSPELTAFPVASVRINELMPKLLAELQGALVWGLLGVATAKRSVVMLPKMAYFMKIQVRKV